MESRFDLGEQLASAARELLGALTPTETMQRAAELAARHLDGDVFASISIVRARREVDTPASTDDRARQADALQYDCSEGPCLDAIWKQDTFQIDDMTTDDRYPTWSRRVAAQTGIRSSLSFQLFTTEDTLGALNVYSLVPHAFDQEDRADGFALAAQAAVAVQSARNEEHLRTAMTTRTVIGQAQGILMERFRLTPQQAFRVLSHVSQENNVKLREVAERLVFTGEVPGG